MHQPAGTPGPVIGQSRKLAIVVAGLAAVVVTMLCAFALPSINSGPNDLPVGVTGPQQSTTTVTKTLQGDKWDVTTYDSEARLQAAIQDREVLGGIVLAPGRVTAYTATAGGPQAAATLTSTATVIAKQQRAEVTVTDLKPFTEDDPKGAGFSSATLPMIFGGMFPAVILSRLFAGHSGLRLRLIGGVAFALVAGFAATAFLQYGTGSFDGNYLMTSLGVSLGMASLVTTLLGLETLMGMAGFGLGAVVIMLLGNPLSGFASGPHWLPDGWAAFGQLLPPGAAGSLLRSNAFFDGTGAGTPALTLSAWVVLGLALMLVADRRGAQAARAVAPQSALAG
ncbi:hypothetical protein [Streptomyces werraensis]|uniref:hypothetical protein n=1 Tax=Streptomyces werraensis TaxID=68284 RepID=UPI00382F56A1